MQITPFGITGKERHIPGLANTTNSIVPITAQRLPNEWLTRGAFCLQQTLFEADYYANHSLNTSILCLRCNHLKLTNAPVGFWIVVVSGWRTCKLRFRRALHLWHTWSTKTVLKYWFISVGSRWLIITRSVCVETFFDPVIMVQVNRDKPICDLRN